MSLKMRASTSNLASQARDYTEEFRTYSFSYQADRDDFTTEECLLDEDNYTKSSYQEKELALKKVNDELERKSNEIFKKIEKYRSINEYTSLDEAGQGDASYSYCAGDANANQKFFTSGQIERLCHEEKPPSPIRQNGSYFSLSRSSSSERYDDLLSSNGTSGYNNIARPVTAAAVAPLHYSVAQTESSARRAETARPIEGIEEKHQIRLQKATESVLKCVQSKLVNYEHRLADMHLQYRQKIQENTMLEAKVKAIDEDRKRLLKSVQALQCTTDKFSKSVESTKMNLNLKAQAFASLKKEMDTLKKDLKQKTGMIQSLQTRLDRCTEENRRLKSQHQSSQLNMKQQHSEDRTTVEDLRQRVVQLEQQKQSLQTTVDKQAHLIRNLRNQKVSLTNVVKKINVKFSDMDDNADEEIS